MYGAKTICLALLLSALAPAAEPPATYARQGQNALNYVTAAVKFGPRPAGSAAQAKQQAWIIAELTQSGATVQEVDFISYTPLGPKRMKNIIGKFPGTSGKNVVVSGHYDTYSRKGLNFVGANDGGSSTGLLLALAGMIKGRTLKDGLWLTFFDGEESTVEWEGNDHTYGSRYLAETWQRDGAAKSIKAIINVDMIGDSDLSIHYEGNSTPWLRDLVVDVAHRLGYRDEFESGPQQYIADDHMEFTARGMSAVDLIDFNYGLLNRHWHAASDTVDKLSARSLAVVLHVIDESLKELAQRP
jgi:Zn-dependent M28 family amino/carboxypeptidase